MVASAFPYMLFKTPLFVTATGMDYLWRRSDQRKRFTKLQKPGRFVHLLLIALLLKKSASFLPQLRLFTSRCHLSCLHGNGRYSAPLKVSDGSSTNTRQISSPQPQPQQLSLSSPSCPPMTSALLQISYDGRRFKGWSAANDSKPGEFKMDSKKPRNQNHRKRHKMEPTLRGFVRSVEGVLRNHLAKVYGNVDPERVVVEGCSRTDKGVHATSMMTLVYGLMELAMTSSIEEEENPIPGKRKPHPRNATDQSVFLPVPMDLPKLAHTLNRMLPPDIRVVGIAPTPTIAGNFTNSAFHPSLSAVSKTYVYTFSVNTNDNGIGTVPDPTMRRWVWNTPNTKNDFNLEAVHEACSILQGTHDFSAFQGAPVGESDKLKRRQASKDQGMCTISYIAVTKLPKEDDFRGLMPVSPHYQVKITGNRFLYKMVRFLVGALVDIGLSDNSAADLERLKRMLSDPSSHDNGNRVFPCAPAHGLVLHKVDYGVNIDWQTLRN